MSRVPLALTSALHQATCLHPQLRVSQLLLLLTLAQLRQASCTELAATLGVTLSAISHGSKSLGTAGRRGSPGLDLITKTRDQADQRIVLLTLTSKGQSFVDALLGACS